MSSVPMPRKLESEGYDPYIAQSFKNTDPGPGWRQALGNATSGTNALQQQFTRQSNRYGQQEADNTNLVNNLYGDIWGGGGGYTDQMKQDILQKGGLDQITDGLDSGFLTDTERRQIEGNPYGAFNLGQGYAGNIEGVSQATGQQQMGYLPYVQGGQDAWLQNMNQGYKEAIDPERLRSSGQYGASVQGALGQAQGYVDDPSMQVTADYLQQARVGDQEVQDLIANNVRDAQAGYQSGVDRLYRNARESGLANPLGVGAMRAQYERGASAAGADAALQARVAGRTAQRDAAQRIQDTQLGAAGQRAGYGTNVAGMAIGAAGDVERARMAGEQDVSNRRMQATTDVAGQGIDNTRFMGQLGIDTAGRAGDRNMSAYQYNANLIPGLYSQGEQNASNRAGTMATNRQGMQQYNTDTRLGVNNTLSNRYQGVYQPWLSNQQEGRQAAQGQQQYFGSRTQDNNQLQLGTLQTQIQGQQGALSGYNNWKQVDKQPGKVAQGFQTGAGFF